MLLSFRVIEVLILLDNGIIVTEEGINLSSSLTVFMLTTLYHSLHEALQLKWTLV
jgi:hypothetical protein